MWTGLQSSRVSVSVRTAMTNQMTGCDASITTNLDSEAQPRPQLRLLAIERSIAGPREGGACGSSCDLTASLIGSYIESPLTDFIL